MKEKEYISASGIKITYGFTETMVKKYLGEPDKKCVNPHYHSAPEEKLWLITKVEALMSNPEIIDYLEKLKIRRDKANEKKRLLQEEKKRHIEEIKKLMKTYSLEYLIEESKKIKKEYYIYCGPTNSGKTYNALKNIKPSTNGQYLGPLRLLAYEIFETLNKKGIPCSLKTGEEEKIVEEAKFISSTIEMANYTDLLDYTVIDEAQLINDEYRGHNYTKALLLSKSKEIHICVSPIGLDLILNLLNKTEMKINIQNYERLAPLNYNGYLNSFKNLKKGDALIVFSRKKVIELVDELENMGISTSMIYGNLPPSNRIVEIKKFTEGKSDVVVCTDAIGMGVSLPIHRVIFLEDEKFDGKEFRKLTDEELKQIAGRAGRYGKYKSGEYLFWHKIPKYPYSKNKSKLTITIPFPTEILNTNIDLNLILTTWNRLADTDEIKYQNLSVADYLFTWLSKRYKEYNLIKKLIYSLITCPFDAKNYDLFDLWLDYACLILDNERPYMPNLKYWDSLKELEIYYKKIELYNHMTQIIGLNPKTEKLMEQICLAINKKIIETKNGFRY